MKFTKPELAVIYDLLVKKSMVYSNETKDYQEAVRSAMLKIWDGK